MKHIIEMEDTTKCLEEVQEIVKKIEIAQENAESLKGNIKFLKVRDVAELLGFTIPTTREIFNRPDFPKCNYGKEMVVEISAFKNYFAKPVMRGDF